MKTYTKQSLIDQLRVIRDKGWIQNNRFGNNGGVGNTLEDLLGIQENNLPLPNAAEWELKAQRKGTTALVTLFHMEPSPRAMNFVPLLLLPNYGWQHKEAGKRYPTTEKSFRQTIPGSKGTGRGFKVIVDYNDRKVLISFDYTQVNKSYQVWLNDVKRKVGLGELSTQPYWGFDDLIHKAGTKLHNCFFAEADMKREVIKGEKVEFYHYTKLFMLKGLDVDKFVDNLDKGSIVVDFDARTGHNHGTKFRLRANHLKDLYSEVSEL